LGIVCNIKKTLVRYFVKIIYVCVSNGRLASIRRKTTPDALPKNGKTGIHNGHRRNPEKKGKSEKDY
jgi:hypothetical protein